MPHRRFVPLFSDCTSFQVHKLEPRFRFVLLSADALVGGKVAVRGAWGNSPPWDVTASV